MITIIPVRWLAHALVHDSAIRRFLGGFAANDLLFDDGGLAIGTNDDVGGEHLPVHQLDSGFIGVSVDRDDVSMGADARAPRDGDVSQESA